MEELLNAEACTLRDNLLAQLTAAMSQGLMKHAELLQQRLAQQLLGNPEEYTLIRGPVYMLQRTVDQWSNEIRLYEWVEVVANERLEARTAELAEHPEIMLPVLEDGWHL